MSSTALGVRARAGDIRNLYHFAAFVTTAVLLLFGAIEASIVLPSALSRLDITWGMDFRLYVERTHSWLDGTGFYLPAQLTGQPYVVESVGGAAVYPPVILYLLVPFALGLPWIAWWLVPMAVIGASIIHQRPAIWQWPILAAILVYPRTWTVFVLGNPAMWALAAVAAGMAWKWPAIGAALKLTFAPLTLLGIRHRSWWIAAGAAILLSLPFAPMWLDYLTAILHAGTSRGMEYVLGEWPIALALAIGCWSGRVAEADADRRPRTLAGSRLRGV